MVKVNKFKDFVERLFWTLAEFGVALPVANWIVGDPLSWWTPIFMGALAALKIAVAQHVGDHGSGDAIPGGVIETSPAP